MRLTLRPSLYRALRLTPRAAVLPIAKRFGRIYVTKNSVVRYRNANYAGRVRFQNLPSAEIALQRSERFGVRSTKEHRVAIAAFKGRYDDRIRIAFSNENVANRSHSRSSKPRQVAHAEKKCVGVMRRFDRANPARDRAPHPLRPILMSNHIDPATQRGLDHISLVTEHREDRLHFRISEYVDNPAQQKTIANAQNELVSIRPHSL